MKRFALPVLWVLALASSLASLTAFAAPANTASSGEAMTLNEALEIAREANPEILAARKRWEAAKEKIPQARSLPDPMAMFVAMKEHLQTRAGPMEEKYAISQKFPFFGKRGLMGEMASGEAVMAHENYRAKALEVFSHVTRAYYELFYVDRSIGVSEELADQLRHFARVAERKFAVGGQSQTSVFRAQVELAKVLNDLISLQQERRSALARVNALLNRTPKTPVRPDGPTDFAFPFDSEELAKKAFEHRPEIRAARAMVEKSEAATALAQRQFFPDLTVGYELSKIGAGTTATPFDGEDAEAYTFQFNVPLWFNRTVPGVREAKANLAAGEALLTNWMNRTAYDVEDWAVKADTASRLVKLYRDTVLPQAGQALKSAQNGYEADRVMFLDLLDSVRMLLRFELEHVRHQANFAQAKAELERVLGVPLSAVETKGDSHD